MTLVIDSSLTLAWHFEDERTEPVRAMLDRVVEDGAIVPGLWRYEVANSLQMAVRRNRITPAYRDQALIDLAAMNIRLDGESESHAWAATVQLAALYGLTVYDAAYLELAQRRRLPLATLDGAMATAARNAGMTVLPA